MQFLRGSKRKRVTAGVTACAIALTSAGIPASVFAAEDNDGRGPSATETPIKHVIVIVGENRSFDHLFGAYKPPRGQTVENLLSKGIINEDGTPGPNFHLATQYQGSLVGPTKFSLTPTSKKAYKTLPPPLTGGTPTVASDSNPPPFATLAAAKAQEGNALLPGDVKLLTTGASGLPTHVIDTRIANASKLPSGPFQLTPSLSYDDYAASPVHRFYQGWQQSDCSVAYATHANPSGCRNDLFAWVEVSIGAGSNGKPQPSGFNDQTTGEGSTALGFYNTNIGDAPYFTKLAKKYAISDNYHQPSQGGTGLDSIILGYGDAIYFTDGHGHAITPPTNEIENPDPQAGTNNYYTQDGYSGGSYSNCSDPAQPGVGAIVTYLASLPNKPKANCDQGHYYLLNNYNPGYNGDGSVNTAAFTIPPSPVRSISKPLLDKNVSWKYYGEGWNTFITSSATSVYCNICNPFLYETAIMTKPTLVAKHLKDTDDLYNDIANGDLPAVSFVKPGGFLDGHPTSSKFDLFEAFSKKIVRAVKQNPKLWASTAIFITVDEGGGYYDSGYIQPLDFFGDGVRIPLIVVSPYSRGGLIAHDYSDHVSILKFIERNWRLDRISNRSRDNLPNPVATADNPYVPTNSPAIGDLFELFQFGQERDQDDHDED
ncbi:alkaline phosphatase family protein [Methylocapsa polymorpha]|uniref:Alkaline phosphatase family protein n=1 Tax=Methylocapsa polymorpha TaxID=3080828 RepID=A0ABZ0HWM6_9HYPH|nr:alkaline phosphatase family protein [Methylocapsa sp. RX1]